MSKLKNKTEETEEQIPLTLQIHLNNEPAKENYKIVKEYAKSLGLTKDTDIGRFALARAAESLRENPIKTLPTE